MPYVKVQLITGRTPEQKKRIAADVTDSLVRHAGAHAEHCFVVFEDIAAEDWVVGGRTVAERRQARGET